MSARCRQRVEHSGVLARVFSVARPTRLTIMSGSLYVGAAAPVRTVFEVTSSGGEFDLSTIDTASLLVRFANGSAATWPATVSAATETSATLTRSHDEDDIPAGAGARPACAPISRSSAARCCGPV